MKRIQCIAILFLCSFNLVIKAQELAIKFSDEKEIHHRNTGWLEDIIISDDSYMYLLYIANESNLMGYDNYYTLEKLDRSTLQVVKTVQVLKKEEINLIGADFEPTKFSRTVVLDDKVLFFYSHFLVEKVELYVKIFDKDLNLVKGATKIMEAPSSKLIAFNKPEIFVVADNDFGRILVGMEKGGLNEDPSVLTYKVIDSSLNVSFAHETTLPYRIEVYKCNFKFDSDKFLSFQFYAKDVVEIPGQSKKKEFKINRFFVLNFISLETGEFYNYPMFYDDKEISDIVYESHDYQTEIIGFFKDLSKDHSGIKNHGIYKVKIDHLNASNIQPDFVYFSDLEMNEIYREDGRTAPMRDVKYISTPRGMVIEDISYLPDGGSVLFCTRIHNYANYYKDISEPHTYKECDKLDITLVRLNTSGEIVWLKTFPRRYTISYAFSSDLNGFYDAKSNSLICTFGKDGPKSFKSAIDDEDYKLEVNYLLIDADNGKFVEKNLPLNSANSDKKSKKFIIPRHTFTVENELYYYFYNDKNGDPLINPGRAIHPFKAIGTLGKFVIK